MNLRCDIVAVVAASQVPPHGFEGDLVYDEGVVYARRGSLYVALDDGDLVVARLADCLVRGHQYVATVTISGESASVSVRPRT